MFIIIENEKLRIPNKPMMSVNPDSPCKMESLSLVHSLLSLCEHQTTQAMDGFSSAKLGEYLELQKEDL